jgi:hypothetical protein
MSSLMDSMLDPDRRSEAERWDAMLSSPPSAAMAHALAACADADVITEREARDRAQAEFCSKPSAISEFLDEACCEDREPVDTYKLARNLTEPTVPQALAIVLDESAPAVAVMRSLRVIRLALIDSLEGAIQERAQEILDQDAAERRLFEDGECER